MSQLSAEEIKNALEHRDVILAIRSVLGTPSGRVLIKYLFKHQEVAELPEIGLEGPLLMDRLGSLRPGCEFFKLVSEADAGAAGSILAEVQKEKNADVYKERRSESLE